MRLLVILAIHQSKDLQCLQLSLAFVLANIKCIGKIQQKHVKTVQIIAYRALQTQPVHNASQLLINGMQQAINAKDSAKIYPNIIIQQTNNALLALTQIASLAML